MQTNQEYRQFFTVIVDNCSPDGSGPRLAAQFSSTRVHVVCNPENGGFAAGNNVGIKHALAHGAEYVWLLNGDTTVDSQALSALVSAAESSKFGAVGSKILYAEGDVPTNRIWSAGGKVDRRTHTVSMLRSGESDNAENESVTVCDYVPGCSMLVHRSTVEQVGYIPEDYFMYFEETDWCMRMQAGGFANAIAPASVVYHHFSDHKMQTPFTVYYYNRNQRIFWSRIERSFVAAIRRRIYTLVRELPQAFKAMRAAPTPAQRELFRAHVRSCTDFIFGRYGKRW